MPGPAENPIPLNALGLQGATVNGIDITIPDGRSLVMPLTGPDELDPERLAFIDNSINGARAALEATRGKGITGVVFDATQQ